MSVIENACLFCKIINKTMPSIPVFEDQHTWVMMDIFPESKGHLLIIPKQHGEDLFAIDDAILTHVMTLSKRLARACLSALNADGIRIAQFNGEAAGQTVFHYHLHVIPAYTGVPFKRHAGEPYDPIELAELAEKIHQTLSSQTNTLKKV